MTKKLILFTSTAALTAAMSITPVFACESMGIDKTLQYVSHNMEGKVNSASDKDKKCEERHNRHIKNAAQILGVKEADLKEKLDNGESLYKLLEDAGKIDEYKQTVLTEKKKKLAKLVSKGKITQEEADEKFKELETMIENWDGSAETELYKKEK